jgi:hypothetical protein
VGKKVTVGLDIQRELKYNINAMRALERRFDKPVPSIFAKTHVGFETMVGLITIGLKYGGMKLAGTTNDEQEEMVGDLVQQHWIDQGRNLTELMEFVLEALREAGVFDAPKGEEGLPENPPLVDTGV